MSRVSIEERRVRAEDSEANIRAGIGRAREMVERSRRMLAGLSAGQRAFGPGAETPEHWPAEPQRHH